ncbi:hypothetical protein L600_000100000360 [Isoptericola variabilis J7]|uniref:Alpha/beta hydrolase fold protein n=1 Tax=Isoptericola variabilis (strain 225) TaxID=743718 RepID=F6FSW4_ISOV2|nr:hypothetical protein Isova_0303 [Isoptericola variabilis 225]TWH35032.1 hypothetical protein L600_000100000360 [Isoptericola variabilis J7]
MLVAAGAEDRVATVLPGSGYTAQGPLLAYPAAVLRDAGWTLRTVVWDGVCRDFDVRDAAERISAGLPAVLAGGTADRLWDPAVAARSGARVVEVPGADHSLEVPGDWRRSLGALAEVTAAVEDLARSVR